jgi:hypothetical protein
VGCEQQSVAFRQVAREKVSVIHHVDCFTGSCSLVKSSVERIRLSNKLIAAPIPLPSAPRPQINAAQQLSQLGRVQFDALLRAGCGWQLKRASLQSLVPNAKPVAIPKQDLDPIALTVQKQEQVARQRVLLKGLLGQAH